MTAGCGDSFRQQCKFLNIKLFMQKLKKQRQERLSEQSAFTIEEHLRVQREIEERAHRFWLQRK
jgi:hypothetical protein